MRPRLKRTCRFAPLAAVALAACQGDPPVDGPPAPPPTTCSDPGTICSFAGNGDPAFTGDGEPALATSLYWPVDLEFAPDGRPYLLDWQNHRVRRIDADGRLRTVIGTDDIGDGPIPGTGDETVAPGVPGTDINLNHPTDLQFSPDGGTMILAAWHNHKIRQMDMATSLADIVCGRGPGFAGDGGPDAAALMNQPKSIALAPSGDLYILDTRNFRIRRIDAATGIIKTVAGVGTRGSSGDGGDPLAAQFSFQADGDNPEPGGAIALDAGGRLYVADTENHRVRVVDLSTGVIDTVAGDGAAGFGGDGGPARGASLQRPFGIAFDAGGDLYVADTLNNRIRRVVKP